MDDREFGISLKDYYGGSFLLAWDRIPDKCNRYHRHKMDSGTIDVNIKTKQPLTETVTVIVYATYSSDIIIEDEKVYVQKNLMWSYEIENSLNEDTTFIGCYPHDKVPKIKDRVDYSVIINS